MLMAFKRIKKIAKHIFLWLLFFSFSAIAGDVKIGYINNQIVNIRSGPGERYDILARYVRGDRLKIAGEKANWYQLQLWGRTTGWIRKDLVTFKKVEVKISFPFLMEKDPPWTKIFKEHYHGNIVFQEGVMIEAKRFRLVEPELIAIDQTKVQKTYNLKGEVVFNVNVKCMIKRRSYLNLFSDAKDPIYFQGVIFQKDPGPFLRGNWIVWSDSGSIDAVQAGSKKEIVLSNSSHFQNWALKDQGIFTLVVYTQGIQLQKGEIPPSDYYILGVKQIAFNLQ